MSGVPRIIYDSAGTDVTSSAQTLLQGNSLLMADMFWLRIFSSWLDVAGNGGAKDFQITSGDFPVQVNNVQTGVNGNLTSTATQSGISGGQTWLPSALKRDSLQFKVGFEDSPFELTWFPTPAEEDLPFYLATINPGNTPTSPAGYGPGTATGLGTYPGDWVFPPHQYADLNAAVLLAAFVDGSGALTGSPMYMGAGPTITAPAHAGTTAVQVGPSGNGSYAGNTGFWVINYTSSLGASGQVTIPGTSYPWNSPSSGFSYYYPSSGGTAPISIPASPGETFTFTSADAGFNLKQILAAGYCDGAPFWYHKAIFNPDHTLLGTTLMFRGYLRDVECADDHIKFTIASLMEAFNQVQVPTQLVQPGNRSVQIVPPQPTQVLGSVLGTSTSTDLQFSATAADHLFQGGFISMAGHDTYAVPNALGTMVPSFIRIRDNITISGTLHLYPVAPIVVNTNSLSPVAAWAKSSLSNSNGAPGFPYIPGPNKA